MENDTRLKTTAERVRPAETAASDLSTSTIERVTEMARETFGDEDKARRWLDRPTTALSGSRPLEALAEGPVGIQRVIDLLKRIDHGLSV